MPKTKSNSEILDELISRVSNGDKSALADLYPLICVSVYSYSLSILKCSQDAQDVLQDTVLEIWRCAKNYQSMGKPMAWIITIAQKRCMEVLRYRSRSVGEVTFELSDCQGTVSAEDRLLIQTVIDLLNDSERQIVILHAVSGFKHREIAKMLGLPISTVLSKYNRAIKKIKKTLEGDFL